MNHKRAGFKCLDPDLKDTNTLKDMLMTIPFRRNGRL